LLALDVRQAGRAVRACRITNEARSVEGGSEEERLGETMMRGLCRLVVGVGAWLLAGREALAWGPEGHQTVAAIADKLLGGQTHAKVKEILGPLILEDAAVWADCAKGVSPKDFTYQVCRQVPGVRRL
jgi:hypothetical protein